MKKSFSSFIAAIALAAWGAGMAGERSRAGTGTDLEALKVELEARRASLAASQAEWAAREKAKREAEIVAHGKLEEIRREAPLARSRTEGSYTLDGNRIHLTSTSDGKLNNQPFEWNIESSVGSGEVLTLTGERQVYRLERGSRAEF